MKRPGRMTMNGRPGRRDRQTKIREMLNAAKSQSNKFAMGGREKTGWRAPRPITLPKLSIQEDKP